MATTRRETAKQADIDHTVVQLQKERERGHRGAKGARVGTGRHDATKRTLRPQMHICTDGGSGSGVDGSHTIGTGRMGPRAHGHTKCLHRRALKIIGASLHTGAPTCRWVIQTWPNDGNSGVKFIRKPIGDILCP